VVTVIILVMGVIGGCCHGQMHLVQVCIMLILVGSFPSLKFLDGYPGFHVTPHFDAATCPMPL